MAGKYQAPSVRKAFHMLRLISKANQGLGISHLANRMEISKGTVHGIISALEDLGALIRDPSSKKYTLGPTLFELGKSAYAELDLRDLARQPMERLMQQTSTSVFVGIPNGDRVTILDVVESNRNLKITAPRGSTVPFLAGAIGKIFLAAMDEEKALNIINKNGIPRFTENTITDPEQYLLHIRRARQEGYADDDEEYIAGVRAAAAPIMGKQGILSAIWAVGFKTALDDEKMSDLINAIQEAAQEINARVREHPLL